MHDQLKKHLLRQINDVYSYEKQLRGTTKYDDLSDLSYWEFERIKTMALAAIHQITGQDSVYTRHASEANKKRELSAYTSYKTIMGILASVRAALENNYLEDTAELIHASLFADFLEMARYLLEEGYKDPAAVIGGSSLEAHLKQLCVKHGIEIEEVTSSGDTRPKKADRMNSDLAKMKAYPLLDQKNVTAWLDLRNRAAHGEYDKYGVEQLRILIDGTRDFITRNPA